MKIPVYYNFSFFLFPFAIMFLEMVTLNSLRLLVKSRNTEKTLAGQDTSSEMTQQVVITGSAKPLQLELKLKVSTSEKTPHCTGKC